MGSHHVSLETFQGPLDLLIYLVRREEVDLADISLERITQDYLAVLHASGELDLAHAGEFLVMAAHLLLLKSRSLLPEEESEEDESLEIDEGDQPWALIRHLIEYKRFQEVAEHLGVSEGTRSQQFSHPSPPPPPEASPPRLEVEADDLLNALERVLQRAKEEAAAEPPAIREDRWTVSDRMTALRTQIPAGSKTSFRNLFSPSSTRGEIIATFLAILELLKTRRLRAVQSEDRGEIELEGLEESLLS
ncbi:MAG: segregation/condensation protein A [Verrucomicrobiota bacterium]